jgi:hypothetical protein
MDNGRKIVVAHLRGLDGNTPKSEIGVNAEPDAEQTDKAKRVLKFASDRDVIQSEHGEDSSLSVLDEQSSDRATRQARKHRRMQQLSALPNET